MNFAMALCHSKSTSRQFFKTIFYCLKVGIVGGGPCGLRYAIETQLLGGRATVIEKRKSFTRNNVLHLWPFVIEDLKMLGTKITIAQIESSELKI